MRDEIQTYIEIMLDKDMIDILEIPASMEKYKKDAISILDMLINYFRDMMLLKENVDKSMIINIDKITFLQNMSKKITYSQVSKIIDIIEDIKKKIRSNCNFNISIQVMALVETARGLEYGTVVVGPKEIDESELVSPLKPIIRIATDEDRQVYLENKEKAKETFELCQQKIKEHDLNMFLIDCEYTFDRNK